MSMDVKTYLALHEELWDIRDRVYNIEDKNTAIILSKMGRIMQEIIACIPKESTDNEVEDNHNVSC